GDRDRDRLVLVAAGSVVGRADVLAAADREGDRPAARELCASASILVVPPVDPGVAAAVGIVAACAVCRVARIAARPHRYIYGVLVAAATACVLRHQWQTDPLSRAIAARLGAERRVVVAAVRHALAFPAVCAAGVAGRGGSGLPAVVGGARLRLCAAAGLDVVCAGATGD